MYLFKFYTHSQWRYKFMLRVFKRNYMKHLKMCARDMLSLTKYLRSVDKMDFDHSSVISYLNDQLKIMVRGIDLLDEFLAIVRGDVNAATDILFEKFRGKDGKVVVSRDQIKEILSEHSDGEKRRLELVKRGTKNEVH